WTGVKMGVERPLTFGPDEMSRLKEIVLNDEGVARPGGGYVRKTGVAEAYKAELSKGVSLKRRIKAVVACGNGTAGGGAPGAPR
ncbi:MAG TPA: phosphomannomutase/phosphoglucomutase, partial [Oceanicaulis sp.]|nr:phosphomannomutase/phosphoglucomutase [Oceanicaulis sp.]